MSSAGIVIIGGGFGGLTVAKALKKSPLDVLLVDKLNHHLFQPLLYEVATAALSPGEIATPLREILRNQPNATVIMGDVTHVDVKKKEIRVANGDLISYQHLVIAVGCENSYFGNEQWAPYAPGLKTISDALKIREHILVAFERAERLNKEADSSAYLNFVIIGGGPTGIEMAGAIAEITRDTLFKNFRKIKPENSQIYLVEALPNLLPSYPKKLAEKARSDLESMGVQVLTGMKVSSITQEGVQVGDFFLESKNVIWAAGNKAPSLLKTLNVPLDRQGRVLVEPDLSIPGDPNVFVIGDSAHVIGKDGKLLPGTAPVAVQQANYVARIISQNISKEKRKSFSYFNKGNMATIGKAKAVVHIWKFQFSGFFAWLIWAFIHILYLIGFRNRFGVMLEWLTIMFTGQRGVRLINRPIDPEVGSKNDPGH